MSSTIFFFLFIPLLAFILLAVNLIFAPHNPYMEKNNVFECGFSSFLGQNRTQFSISFFIFALLFLLFDLEILLVYPYLVSAYTNGVYGLAIMLMFLLALTLGFAFELGKKALDIDSRQMSQVTTNKSNYLNQVRGKISLDVMNISKRNYHSKRSDLSWFELLCNRILPLIKLVKKIISLKKVIKFWFLRSFNTHLFITSSSIPQPNHFIHLPVQSNLFKPFISKAKLSLLTSPLCISIVIGVGLSLAYKIPMRCMLGQLDLLTWYAVFNLMVCLCGIIIIADLTGKQVKPIQLYLTMVLSFVVTFLTWYANGHHYDLCAFFVILPSYFSSIWPSEMTLGKPGNYIGDGYLSYMNRFTFLKKNTLDPNSASSSPGPATASANNKPASSVPAEIKEIILSHFDASDLDVKNKINAIFKDFHVLESLYIEIISLQDHIDVLDLRVNKGNLYMGSKWNADLKLMQSEIKHLFQIQKQHISLQDKVSKDVSKLIRVKILREAVITKGFSFAEGYIEYKNSQRLYNDLPKINNINDMVKQLDSYKAWRKQDR